MGDALRLVAHLASPLAGDPPQLDALLVYVASRILGKGADVQPGYKVDRKFPCPPVGHIPIGVRREMVGGWPVARCSAPIMPEPRSETVQHLTKRLGVEHAQLIDPAERRVVTTASCYTKSYRLPVRVRRIDRVVWLCVGGRADILKYLRYVPAIGKDTNVGYGRVDRWECERLGEVPHRWWPWWCESEVGPVLMRALPLGWDRLPQNLLGAKRDYGACSDPYWHPDRYCDIITPC